jgi:pyridoxine 5-phosphate synthase
VAGGFDRIRAVVTRLRGAGIRISLFIDPDLPQVEAAARMGVEMIELHTGCFANAAASRLEDEILRLREAAVAGHAAGLQVNAGHGINYRNIRCLFPVPHLTELNIGHSIVSKAMRVGMTTAVRGMKELMASYPG